jgi:hypothetical protein
MDFTYVRTWAEVVYVSFVVAVFAQMFVGSYCPTTNGVELIMTSLRMATWQRRRDGHRSRVAS